MDKELEKIVERMIAAGESNDAIEQVIAEYNSSKKKVSGEPSVSGTTEISPSSSQSQSPFSTGTSLDPLAAIERNKKTDLMPRAIKPTVTPISEINAEPSSFLKNINPADKFGRKVIRTKEGVDIGVDPRTIPLRGPFSAEANEELYVKGVQDRLVSGTTTDSDNEFIKKNERSISRFSLDDEDILTKLSAENGLDLNTISGEVISGSTAEMFPEMAGKKMSELGTSNEAKYIQVKALRAKLEKEIKEAEFNSLEVKGAGNTTSKKIIAANKEKLEEIELLETKLSRKLAKVSDVGIEGANVRTDEGGNLLVKAGEFIKDNITLGASLFSEKNNLLEDKIKNLAPEVKTGLNYMRFKDPVVYERIMRSLAKGEPISETQVAQIGHLGIDIEKDKLDEELESGGISQEEYDSKKTGILQKSYENLVGNKEALRSFMSSEIAEVLDDRYQQINSGRFRGVMSKIYGHVWNYDDGEIAQAAQVVARANGFDVNDSRIKDAVKHLQDNEGAMILQNSISKNGWIRSLGKGLAQPIRGIATTISGLSQTDAEQYAESQSQGGVNISELNVKRIEDSWEGDVGQVIEGVGQLVSQVGLSYLASAGAGLAGKALMGEAGVAVAGESALAGAGARGVLGKALLGSKDGVATFVTTFASTYGENKKTALGYTSNNATATTAGVGLSFVEALSEGILSPLELARGIKLNLFNKKEVSRGLVNIIDDVAVVDKEAAIRSFFTAALKGGGQATKVLATEIGEEGVVAIADYGTNMMLNPDSQSFQDRDLVKELGSTAYQTGLSMAIPALLGGVGAFSANNFSKASLLIAAQNTQHFIDDMKVRLYNGEMTQEEYNQKVELINTAEVVNAKLPAKVDGTKMTPQQKADYIFSRVSEAALVKQAEQSDDEAEKSIIAKKILDHQEFRKQVLNNENNQVPGSENATGQNTQTAQLPQAQNTTQSQASENLAEDDKVFLRETFEAGALPVAVKLSVTAPDGTLDEAKLPQALREIASQSQGITLDGTRLETGANDLVGVSGYPQALVDLANKQYPLEGLAKTKEAVDVIQPAMERIGKSEPVNEVELNKAQDALYEAIDANPDAAPLLEPLILKLQDYDNTTTTETRTITESVPIEGAFAARSKRQTTPFLETAKGKNVTVTLPDGSVRSGTFDIKGGQYAVDVPGGTQIVLGEKALTDLQIDLPTEEEMENPITFDEFDRPESITFKVSNGNLVTINDPGVALDLAIRLKAEVLGEISDDRFEQAFQQVQREIQVEVPVKKQNGTTSTPAATAATAAVPAATPTPQGQAAPAAASGNTTGASTTNATATAPVLTEKEQKVARLKAAREKSKAEKKPAAQKQGEPIVADGKNAATLKPKSTDSELKKKLISDSKKAIAVLKSILPDLKIVIYDTDASFREALGIDDVARGGYKDGVISINLEVMEDTVRRGASSNTIVHEMVHPILNIIAPTGSKQMSDLFDQLVELKNLPGVAAVLRYGKSQKDYFEANGNAKQQRDAVAIGKTEAVVEFIAQLANGDIDLRGKERSVLKKVADLLKNFVKMIGGKSAPINNVSDLKKLAEQISGAFESGRTLLEANIVRDVANSGVQLQGEYDITGEEDIVVGKAVSTRNVDSDEIAEESLAAAKQASKGIAAPYIDRAVRFANGSMIGPQSNQNNIVFPYVNKPLSKRIDKLRNDYSAITGTSKEAKAQKDKLWDKMQTLSDQVYSEFKETLKTNITAIFKSYNKDFAKRSKTWYEGANRIAQNMSKVYGISLEGSSAIIAALSPQTPWFANVSAAYRVMNIMKNHATTPVTKEMFRQAELATEGKPFSAIAAATGRKHSGKTLADVIADADNLTQETVSTFLRVIDENIHSKSVPVVSPEGRIVSISSDSFAWGSPNELVKAMLIYTNPSMANVSKRLGKGNKVRNFYNNIANPNSDNGEVTVDTHAIGVGFLNLISSQDASSLGLFSNNKDGFSMMYTVLKEAYQEVAKKEGYLPREMQSITWEAMRLLVSDKNKADISNRDFINDIWKEKQKNNITHEQAIGEIIGRFEYDRPDWDRATDEGIGNEILQGDGYSLYKKDGDGSDIRGQQDVAGQDTSDMADNYGWRPVAGVQFQGLGDLRDNKHFKFADLSYPDVVFGDINTDSEADIAINFYKKIVAKFNKEFGRDLKLDVEKGSNGKFSVSVEYETGLTPKYFAYPSKKMGEHKIVDTITNEVPLTSLRHELIHEMLVKHITDKFERINNLDQSASAASIEEVQRNRAYNYTLEDVFFERVVENVERMPDGVDTFSVDTYGTDVTNRLQEELKGKVTKEKVMSKLGELLEGANPWLQDALTKIFDGANYDGVTDVRDMAQSVGKKFKQRFDVAKDIFPKDLQQKVLDFTNLFNDEYQGVQTRLAKQIKSPELKTFEVGYAPFREGNIKTLDGSSKVFEGKRYKQWIAMAKQFAGDLGITIDTPVPNVGIYGATSNDMEASALVSVTGDLRDVETFAALMGTLAPDTQHSVMLNTYNDDADDTEHKIVFKTREAAEDFLKKKKIYGVSDISFDPATNTATVLEISRFNSTFDHEKLIANHGQDIERHDFTGIENRFIEEGSYLSIIQRGRDKINEQDKGKSGENLRDVYKLAVSRIERQSGNRATLPQSKKKALTRSVFDYIGKYGKSFGLSFPSSFGKTVPFSEDTSAKIYEAYTSLAIDNSSDPEVARSYEQLVKEVDAQYKFITEDLGMDITFMDNDPYEDSVDMMADVYSNNHLKVFKGGEPHAFLDQKDDNGLSANEKFRAVHDYFGHAVEGNQFGKKGEEAAWAAHSQMFSPLAQRAMSTETRGQNSWVNNSPVNVSALSKFAQGNDLVKSGRVTEGKKMIQEAQSEFQFADQKVDLLPVELTQPMQFQGIGSTLRAATVGAVALATPNTSSAAENTAISNPTSVSARSATNPVALTRDSLVARYGSVIAGRWNDYKIANKKTPEGKSYRDVFNDVAATYDLPVELFFASAVEEGLRDYVIDREVTEDADFPVNGFVYFGLDNFTEMAPALKKADLLPADFSFSSIVYKNEQGTKVNSANFKTTEDAIIAKAAILSYMDGKMVEFADKNDIALSPDAQNFFMLVAYNAGMGNAKKMMADYQAAGALENDSFLSTRPTKGNSKVTLKDSSWEQPYTYAMRRVIPARAWKDSKIFDTSGGTIQLQGDARTIDSVYKEQEAAEKKLKDVMSALRKNGSTTINDQIQLGNKDVIDLFNRTNDLQEERMRLVAEEKLKPAKSKSKKPAIDIKQVQDNIYYTESKIEDLEGEILIEKGNLKEEIARIKAEIAKVRESKMSKDEKEDKIEDLKYEIEDAKDSADNMIESYKDDIANEKDDLKRYNRELKKAEASNGGMQFQLDPTADFGITDAAYDEAIDNIINDIEVNDLADIDAITNAVVKLRKQFGTSFKEDDFVDHIVDIIDDGGQQMAVDQRTDAQKMKDEVVELAKKIKAGTISYNNAIKNKSPEFIAELNKAVTGKSKMKFDDQAFRETVRKQKEFGMTADQVIESFATATPLTQAQKAMVYEVFAETAERDRIADELKEAFEALAKGQKPKSVLERLSVSNVTHLVGALTNAMEYKAVSNKQLDAAADYIVGTIDLKKADQYINALVNSSFADVRQVLRAKVIVALEANGNSALAEQMVLDMADDATISGRQIQSLKLAYEILKAKGSPTARAEFERRAAEKVQEKARMMNAHAADVISKQQVEITSLNAKLHEIAQKSSAMNKIKEVITKLCNLRLK